MRRTGVFLLAGACVAGAAATSQAATLTEILEDYATNSVVPLLDLQLDLNDDSAANFYANPGGSPVGPGLSEADFVLAAILGDPYAEGVFEVADINDAVVTSGAGFYNHSVLGLVAVPEVVGEYRIDLVSYNAQTNIGIFDATFSIYEDPSADSMINPTDGVVGTFGATDGATLFAEYKSGGYELTFNWQGDTPTLVPSLGSFISATNASAQSFAVTGGAILGSTLFNGPFTKPIGGINSVTVSPAGAGSAYVTDGYAFIDTATLTLEVVPSPLAAGPALAGFLALGLCRRRGEAAA